MTRKFSHPQPRSYGQDAGEGKKFGVGFWVVTGIFVTLPILFLMSGGESDEQRDARIRAWREEQDARRKRAQEDERRMRQRFYEDVREDERRRAREMPYIEARERAEAEERARYLSGEDD